MNIAALSIKRPIFITSIVTLMVFTGYIALGRLGVDLFPNVNIPVVVVTTQYVGAGPQEIESLISKPLEDELGSISGLKRITSRNQEGFSQVVAEFNLSTDIKYAEQQVRDKTARARSNFPEGTEEPLILRFDPAEQPVVRLSLSADLPPAELYNVAREEIKTRLEQVPDVATVRISGGTRREIQVELDRQKLNDADLSAVGIAQQLKNAGLNVPVGRNEIGASETSFRTIGRFETIEDIKNSVVSFGGDVGGSLNLGRLGEVLDSVEDPKTLGFLYARMGESAPLSFWDRLTGKKAEVVRETRSAVFLDILKQSGTNTVKVADATVKRMQEINLAFKDRPGKPQLVLVRDSSRWIRANVEDVAVSIVLGVLLAVIVVYLFLGNMRSTIITGLALPNSLLGAFVLMWMMGFTINVMTLLALSLTVGLLVDDAIVVRENIFRKLEHGMPVVEAAERGTKEVTLAVIATSATVIAVFLPVGFLSGMVGQFFKEFGLTIVFAMLISLFDALTVAPMLSAYFAGKMGGEPNRLIRTFDRFQDWLSRWYGKTMDLALNRPAIVLGITGAVFILSIASLGLVKKTFMPPNDQGEFMVSLEMPPGTSLAGTLAVAREIESELKALPEVDLLATVVGDTNGDPTQGQIGIILVPAHERSRSTLEIKEYLRQLLTKYAKARPRVNDYSAIGGVQYPFNLNFKGDDLAALDAYATKVIGRIKEIKDLADVDTTHRSGKPEFQVRFDRRRMEAVGVQPAVAGSELRYHIAGGVVGKLYDKGLEYDIRMRLRPDQRDLRSAYNQTRVPNMNFRMIPLKAISSGTEEFGPAVITRQDRARVITVTANLAPDGAIASATDAVRKILEEELPPPAGITYAFVGQSEDFKELLDNIVLAFGLALLFIYLVLASLYESFITPVTILIALPPAISGAFLSLALTGEMLNIFSMIGTILLMGLVTKNSILLVDHAMQRMREGLSRSEAIYEAGMVRLRPILMTSLAMIAGTVPVALGLGEAAKSRTSMGIAIIGGLVGSTILTLVVVPAVFGYIDRFREWVESPFRPDVDMSRVGHLDDLPTGNDPHTAVAPAANKL